MVKREGAVHVATVRKTSGGKVHETHLLRRTYREGPKVKHQTLGNISHLPAPIIELIRGALRGETYAPVSGVFEILESHPHGHVAAVLGTLRKLNLERILAYSPSRQRELVVAMVVARILEPLSKLATFRGLRAETKFTSLGKCLGLGCVREDELYEALDWLVSGQRRIEGKLAKRHLEEGCLVLYDVTSTYYTGSHCSLAEYGHNRDAKKGYPQIVFGLLCNREGCPVAVEVFEGNVGDPKTLGSQLQKVRERFGLRRVVIVGDRGMITEARIRDELSPVEGLDWISALRGPAIRALVEAGSIQLSLFDERDLAEVSSFDYPGERLIACRNPLLAEERGRKREELLRATEKEIEKIVVATQRKKAPLKGKDLIGVRVGKVVGRYKMGKHFRLHISEDVFRYERDTERIATEAALDGIYVIRTSMPVEKLNTEETVLAYKGLSVVEQAFRSLKSVDLKVRPIYHRLEDRVRAHVFLCMLAYYVEWHMRRALAPILFDDEEQEESEAVRASVVAPARRSSKAKRKAQTRHTVNGEPVHSFRTLILDLATIANNHVRTTAPGGGKPVELDMITTPTPLQSRAFELLGVSLAM